MTGIIIFNYDRDTFINSGSIEVYNASNVLITSIPQNSSLITWNYTFPIAVSRLVSNGILTIIYSINIEKNIGNSTIYDSNDNRLKLLSIDDQLVTIN